MDKFGKNWTPQPLPATGHQQAVIVSEREDYATDPDFPIIFDGYFQHDKTKTKALHLYIHLHSVDYRPSRSTVSRMIDAIELVKLHPGLTYDEYVQLTGSSHAVPMGIPRRWIDDVTLHLQRWLAAHPTVVQAIAWQQAFEPAKEPSPLSTTRATLIVREGAGIQGRTRVEMDLIRAFSPAVARDNLLMDVYQESEPVFSGDVQAAFQSLNDKKHSQGLLGYYPGRRYRIVAPPDVDSLPIIVHLAPINYAFVALMKDDDADAATKGVIASKIAEAADRLPPSLRSEDPIFNSKTYSILGIEVCIVTIDGFTLLRRRGSSVLTGLGAWDVAVSGHPTEEDIYRDRTDRVRIDIAQTVYRETLYEIGHVNGDVRRMRFTGLHHNKESGDVDLCVLWPISNTAKELAALLTEKEQDKVTTVFQTTTEAIERYVWDTDNLLLEFAGPSIVQTLDRLRVRLDEVLVEAMVALELALRSLGRPTLGLNLSR